jgi:hypothetical protein
MPSFGGSILFSRIPDGRNGVGSYVYIITGHLSVNPTRFLARQDYPIVEAALSNTPPYRRPRILCNGVRFRNRERSYDQNDNFLPVPWSDAAVESDWEALIRLACDSALEAIRSEIVRAAEHVGGLRLETNSTITAHQAEVYAEFSRPNLPSLSWMEECRINYEDMPEVH